VNAGDEGAFFSEEKKQKTFGRRRGSLWTRIRCSPRWARNVHRMKIAARGRCDWDWPETELASAPINRMLTNLCNHYPVRIAVLAT
jgi:hypothetical protein